MDRRMFLKGAAVLTTGIALNAIQTPFEAKAGTHMRIIVLYQTGSLADLQRQRPNIESLLRLPGVAGFSVRVPGNVLNPSKGVWDLSTFELAADIARDNGKELQTRAMGGRWAPEHARGNTMVFDGSKLPGEQFQLPVGTKVPVCFDPDGTRNDTYYNWMLRCFDKMAAFGTANNLKVQHFFWPGLTWAEIAVIGQMAEMPGFNFATVQQFHVDVMKAAHTKWSGDVEFALSGHVIDPYKSIFGTLLTQAKTSNRYIINRNDIGGPHMGTGTTLISKLRSISNPPRHGWQMWGTQTDYPWATILNVAEEMSNGYPRADYLEIYPQSFQSSVLKTEIARRYA